MNVLTKLLIAASIAVFIGTITITVMNMTIVNNRLSSKNIMDYKEISNSLNSPEFNSKLLEFYDDGKITRYESDSLEDLALKIKEEKRLLKEQKRALKVQQEEKAFILHLRESIKYEK